MMNFKVEPFSVLSASSCIVQGDINSESSKEEFSNWESEHVELVYFHWPGECFLGASASQKKIWIQKNWKILTRLYPDLVVTQSKTWNVVLIQFVTDWWAFWVGMGQVLRADLTHVLSNANWIKNCSILLYCEMTFWFISNAGPH